MTPQEEIQQLKEQVASLMRWKEIKESQQFSFPIDTASMRTLAEAFRYSSFDVINLGSITINIGTGAPTFTANKGSLYINLTGSSTSTRAYVNTDGSTGWTSITTAT